MPLPSRTLRCCHCQAVFPSLTLPPTHVAQGQGSHQLSAPGLSPEGQGKATRSSLPA